MTTRIATLSVGHILKPYSYGTSVSAKCAYLSFIPNQELQYFLQTAYLKTTQH